MITSVKPVNIVCVVIEFYLQSHEDWSPLQVCFCHVNMLCCISWIQPVCNPGRAPSCDTFSNHCGTVTKPWNTSHLECRSDRSHGWKLPWHSHASCSMIFIGWIQGLKLTFRHVTCIGDHREFKRLKFNLWQWGAITGFEFGEWQCDKFQKATFTLA